MRKQIAAFTLIELIVVMVVMGLLAAITVMTLGGTMDRYHLTRAAETFEMFDARVRRDARKSRVVHLASIDRRRNRLSVIGPDNRTSVSFSLPRQVEVAEFRIKDADGRNRTARGPIRFQVAGSGRSPTYAMRLQRGKSQRWLVVLGFSGQVVSVDDDEEMNELFSL